jgi:hypothetical protein
MLKPMILEGWFFGELQMPQKCSADYVGFPVSPHQLRLRNLAAKRPLITGS